MSNVSCLMRSVISSAAIALALVSGCTSPEVELRSRMVGVWELDVSSLGERTISHLHLRPDGTFEEQIWYETKFGRVANEVLSGVWQVEGAKMTLAFDEGVELPEGVPQSEVRDLIRVTHSEYHSVRQGGVVEVKRSRVALEEPVPSVEPAPNPSIERTAPSKLGLPLMSNVRRLQTRCGRLPASSMLDY